MRKTTLFLFVCISPKHAQAEGPAQSRSGESGFTINITSVIVIVSYHMYPSSGTVFNICINRELSVGERKDPTMMIDTTMDAIPRGRVVNRKGKYAAGKMGISQATNAKAVLDCRYFHIASRRSRLSLP